MDNFEGAELVGECRTGPQWSELRRLRFVFQNFAHINQRKVVTPVLECHGCEWSLVLYPRGNSSSSSSNGGIDFVSLLLRCESFNKDDSPEGVTAQFWFHLPPCEPTPTFHRHLKHTFVSTKGSGFDKFASRSGLLRQSFLSDSGDLCIEVGITVMMDKSAMKPIEWSPKNMVCRDMLKMLEDAAEDEDANIVFEVGQGSTPSRHGHFHTHRNILKSRSPVLAALTEGCSDGGPIPIDDVEPEIFQMLLRFIYGGEIPDKDILEENAKAIISAADRFACTGLKLAAETELAAAGITIDNAADLLLFADGTNCAMLKEAAVEFFVANPTEVMQSDGFSKVQESNDIMKELMAESFVSKKRKAQSDSNGSESKNFKRMKVAELRQKLDEKGMDVDGSKELLIARLEEAETVVRE